MSFFATFFAAVEAHDVPATSLMSEKESIALGKEDFRTYKKSMLTDAVLGSALVVIIFYFAHLFVQITIC